MTPIRALIVDDEPLAREKLRTLLAREPDVQIVGECGDGALAVHAIREHRPDLVFLDVQMPTPDGFGVVRAVGAERMPVTIFVTAFDRYALRAFEVGALDYLLKPFDRDRFRDALRRARRDLERGRAAQRTRELQAMLARVAEPAAAMSRFAIRSGGRVRFVDADEVDWIEAAGNYARLHAGGEEHLLRATLSRLERDLEPRRFVRAHRSALVNVSRVRELRTFASGDGELTLVGGARVPVSRTHRERLAQRLGAKPR